jgi:hypothetical protein
MAAKIHRSLKVIAINANGIWTRCYKLSKQLQDGCLLSETQLKTDERFFSPNYNLYRAAPFPGRKGIPHNQVDLSYMWDRYTWRKAKHIH